MFKTLVTLGALALSTTIAFADVKANKKTAEAALDDVFVKLDASKIDTYFAEPYIQHNPVAKSGLEALHGLVDYAKAGPGFRLKTVRVIGEGDLVAMHNIWTGFGPGDMIAFDVFRFNEDGKIVKHGDVIADIQTDKLPEGYPGKF
ncbi:MAG: nuclear transport factor 2 family protein [Pseudomonadota bacterium]